MYMRERDANDGGEGFAAHDFSSQEKVETLECVRIKAKRVKVQRVESRLKAEFLLLQGRALIRGSAHRRAEVGVPPRRVVVFLVIPPIVDRRLHSP